MTTLYFSDSYAHDPIVNENSEYESRTCCPIQLQELLYTRYKRHDSRMYRESEVHEMLARTMPANESNGPVYALYGDLAYPQSIWLLEPFSTRGCQDRELPSNGGLTLLPKCVVTLIVLDPCKYSSKYSSNQSQNSILIVLFLPIWSTAITVLGQVSILVRDRWTLIPI
jgi:hypothetical protein